MTLSLVPISIGEERFGIGCFDASLSLDAWFAAHPNACGSDVALEVLSRIAPLDATDIRDIARSYCPDDHRQFVTAGFIWRGLLTLERNGAAERFKEAAMRCFKWRLRERPAVPPIIATVHRPMKPRRACLCEQQSTRSCDFCGQDVTCDLCRKTIARAQSHEHAVLSGLTACGKCAAGDIRFRDARAMDVRAYRLRRPSAPLPTIGAMS